MSPDSVSSLFPDRPIRPLPKRSIRERLSPDVADTIKYPPAAENVEPLFYYPFDLKGESRAASAEAANIDRENGAEPARGVGFRRSGLGGPHDEDGPMYQARRALVSRPFHESPRHHTRTPPRLSQGRHQNPQAPPSTASSADGYESFENTNNKKKRKIPTAGETMLSGTHVLSDSSVMGIPSPPTTGDEGPSDSFVATPTPYYHPGSVSTNGQGISGPGRGRYGRNRNGRSPLRQLPEANLSWNGKNLKSRTGGQYPPSPAGENNGIISNAIASAEKLPMPQGQENISLLQQQASSKVSPTSSQFTFTFDSQVPGTVSWPGSNSASTHMARGSSGQQHGLPADGRAAHYGDNTRGAQAGQPPLSKPVGTHTGPNASTEGGGRGVAPATGPQRKPKRRGNPLLQAAKQRRQETEYQNYHHPPAPEDVWICEFCEYERIFGRPPEALIRQYEIKDRRRRREEAERRRLLAKAKMKSRKGKKASKLPAKNNAPVQDRSSVQATGHHAPHMGQDPSQELHSEEFDEDDYYEDDIHDENCPSVAHGHNFETHASSMISQAGRGTTDGGGQDNRVPIS